MTARPSPGVAASTSPRESASATSSIPSSETVVFSEVLPPYSAPMRHLTVVLFAERFEVSVIFLPFDR